MPKFNRKCLYCGKEYYCCCSCVSINSWKNTHCSIECFLKTQESGDYEKVSPFKINDGGNYIMRAGLKNGKTIDIVGYDLDLMKFDCSDKTTKVLEDFDYFIVDVNEMKNFINKPKETIKPIVNTEKEYRKENTEQQVKTYNNEKNQNKKV